MNHECKIQFDTEIIDNCSGTGFDRCFGMDPMNLELWFPDTDGIEEYFDNWIKREIKFCPYCGMKAE